VAANTKMSVDAGSLTAQECLDARRFMAQEPREVALLNFVRRVLETKGKVSDADLVALRGQGFDDEDIVEILAGIIITTLTNYMSSVGQPDLDFPEVPAV
jgi:alkylhydroperoxidase family enzyme